MKQKNTKISAQTVPNFSDDSIRISARSFVVDNKWVNFKGSIFKLQDYIDSVVRGSRTRFFKDRNYAVYLLIGLDLVDGVQVIEGTHVKFTTLTAVPPPQNYTVMPLAGLIVIQNGTSDLVSGYKPLKNENIVLYSGYGNIIDRNIKGDTGDDSTTLGETGIYGFSGIDGTQGITGYQGLTGNQGPVSDSLRGYSGLQGATGINWDIHIPFDEFL